MDLPPPIPQSELAIVTRERLRLLALAYNISGAFGAVMASFFLIYVVGLGALSFVPTKDWDTPKVPASSVEAASPHLDPQSSAPPVIFLRIMAGIMAFFVLCGWTLSGLTFYAGQCIRARKYRLLIHIMAGFNAIWIPYGTLLCIASFLVLTSEAGKAEFSPRSY